MRAFLAIDLPEDLRAQVAALQAGLRAGRPVPEENLHLTLAFLDDQPQAMLAALHEVLNALDCPGFDLELAGLDLFGGKHPRLLYLRAKPAPALLALHRSLKEAARRVGMDLPRTRFRPHVTLARFRHDMTEPEAARLGLFMSAHADATFAPWPVTRYHLFASTLHPRGAEHEILADYALQGGSG